MKDENIKRLMSRPVLSTGEAPVRDSEKPQEVINQTLAEMKSNWPRCQMLIDQDKFIGEDPIGHVCDLPAVWKIRIRARVMHMCGTCAATLKDPQSDEFKRRQFPASIMAELQAEDFQKCYWKSIAGEGMVS